MSVRRIGFEHAKEPGCQIGVIRTGRGATQCVVSFFWNDNSGDSIMPIGERVTYTQLQRKPIEPIRGLNVVRDCHEPGDARASIDAEHLTVNAKAEASRHGERGLSSDAITCRDDGAGRAAACIADRYIPCIYLAATSRHDQGRIYPEQASRDGYRRNAIQGHSLCDLGVIDV